MIGCESMTKYRVFFGDRLRVYFDVEAESKEEAVEKARKKWKKDIDNARIVLIQEIK